MKDPKTELKNYLKKLVTDFIYLKSLFKQISLFLNWQRSNGLEGIKHSSHFFYLFFYSAKRTLCLDTYKLISPREKRGIPDWLNKALESYNTLSPSVYVGWSEKLKSERRNLKEKEYQDLISTHLDELAKHEKIIGIVTSLRDKGFAHADKKYFRNPDLLEKDYPVDWDLLENLFQSTSEILREQYSLIFKADMSMELVSGSDIDTILKRSRGFERFWRNNNLNELGFKKYVFLRDDYDEDDIYL